MSNLRWSRTPRGTETKMSTKKRNVGRSSTWRNKEEGLGDGGREREMEKTERNKEISSQGKRGGTNKLSKEKTRQKKRTRIGKQNGCLVNLEEARHLTKEGGGARAFVGGDNSDPRKFEKKRGENKGVFQEGPLILIKKRSKGKHVGNNGEEE